MALDGAFLRHVKREIEEHAINTKIDKIHQPNRDEIVLSLRGLNCYFKLLISARANSPRIHFTDFPLENPKSPPMFCMLLRKRLSGAKLVRISQPDLERILYLDFDARNELGDIVKLSLAVEIMGKYSNIILLDEEDIVIDSLRRVDMEMSSKRIILPGVKYELPPSQNKLCMLNEGADSVISKILSAGSGELGILSNMPVSKAVLSKIQGLSPLVCREIEYMLGEGEDVSLNEIAGARETKFKNIIKSLHNKVNCICGKPYAVIDENNKPIEFSFFDISQYGRKATVKSYDSFSKLLDNFYFERDQIDRMRVKTQNISKLLTNIMNRLSKKINIQNEEIEQCAQKDKYRVYGDLINSNLYKIEKGLNFIELENFYEEGSPIIKIKLDPFLTPAKNAQKYYKEYKKAAVAENMLKDQIALSKSELEYIGTVFDSLSRANSESDIAEIRQELFEQKYIKSQKVRQRNSKLSGPIQFVSTDGLQILVGRNNHQNDNLTMKQAKNNDIWFHVKNIPGSHTVLVTDGKEPSEHSLYEAAVIAAVHSKAKNSSNVPVDYTEVRNVSKPNGARPGMVIYIKYKTLYVNPDLLITDKLKLPN